MTCTPIGTNIITITIVIATLVAARPPPGEASVSSTCLTPSVPLRRSLTVRKLIRSDIGTAWCRFPRRPRRDIRTVFEMTAAVRESDPYSSSSLFLPPFLFLLGTNLLRSLHVIGSTIAPDHLCVCSSPLRDSSNPVHFLAEDFYCARGTFFSRDAIGSSPGDSAIIARNLSFRVTHPSPLHFCLSFMLLTAHEKSCELNFCLMCLSQIRFSSNCFLVNSVNIKKNSQWKLISWWN